MKIRFTHLRDDFGVPFATIATDDTRRGVAICSGRDQFARKIGRNISEGRMKAGVDGIPNSQRTILFRGEVENVTDVVDDFVSKMNPVSF